MTAPQSFIEDRIEDRIEAAAQAGWERNIADQMARGKFPPHIAWKDVDDATRAAWRSVAQAIAEAWERIVP